MVFPSLWWQSSPLGPSGSVGIKIRWLGTAGVELVCQGYTLLIDPYVSRHSIARCLCSPLRPDLAAIARYAPHADSILLGHTHFDHALDCPEIAKRSGARVLGSSAAVHLCRAAGLEDTRLVDVSPTDSEQFLTLGPFEIQFVRGVHSALIAGRVPFDGDIAQSIRLPMRVYSYRCASVFAIVIRVRGRTLVHMGSAALAAASGLPKAPDLVMLCAAGWTKTPGFAELIARNLSPHAVLLTHWDDFFRPLSAPVRPLPGIGLPSLADSLVQSRPQLRVGITQPLQELWL